MLTKMAEINLDYNKLKTTQINERIKTKEENWKKDIAKYLFNNRFFFYINKI